MPRTPPGSRRREAAPRTATHRPAVKPRRFRHDSYTAVDLFSGFGGLTAGIQMAGFETIMAANHNPYKTEVHEANHPYAEHWVADLINPESSDYHSPRDLPAADLLAAGVTCTNHSQANTQKAYELGLTLFDFEDADFEERATRSERDRATALCVLQYAQHHHPMMILVECTTELTSWGPAIPGRSKVGDGSTYRWWIKQFDTLGYDGKTIYLNSQFFGVGQSRDRYYRAFWDRRLPAPDLEHRPLTWCANCSDAVEAVWTWRTGIPPTGSVRYGKQYDYRCPRCRIQIVPPTTPSLGILDLTNLGTRIGDRAKPLAAATMERADRCRKRFADFPAILMPAKAVHGVERHPWQPMATQTSQQETALLSTGAIMTAAGNTYERPGSTCRSRGVDEPMWAQTATNTVGLMTPPVEVTGHVIAAHRHNGDGQHISRPMDTVTTTHEKAVLLGVHNYQGAARGVDEPLPTQGGSETLSILSAGVVPFRKNTIPSMHTEPMPTVTADQIPGLLMAAGWYKQNGTEATATAPHPVTDPFGTLTARDTTGLLTAQLGAALADVALEDCYFRMLAAHEVGRGCGFDTTFPNSPGTFQVWGTPRAQVDGFGNAVSPQVGAWIGARLREVLDREAVL